MKRRRFLILTLALALCLSLIPPSAVASERYTDIHSIRLSSIRNEDGSYAHSATVDGANAPQYDYVWHANPMEVHSDIANAPAEFYTGTKPDSEAAVYIAHDIYYFPSLPQNLFRQVNYDGDSEWAFYYTADEYKDFIFGTLPAQRSGFPVQMMHTPQEAYNNAVLHITRAGTYRLQGDWFGQIWIDLGDKDETFSDASAKVTLILNNVDITCTVAPAVVFYSVYECDYEWESRETHTSVVADGSDTGANVVIADGTVNHIVGANVYRMLRTQYKSEENRNPWGVRLQKKRRKTDGALYSYVSLRVRGETAGTGVLNIKAGFEGLDSELHLFLDGGNVHIYSQDDGINVNEDGVSVVTINGGNVHILAGMGEEGDGIDSNGYLVVNGGTLITMASPQADSGMDSDCGTFVNGGSVVALGSTMDWAESDEKSAPVGQATMNLQFAAPQSADEAIIVTDTDGRIVFAYDPEKFVYSPEKDKAAVNNARWYQGAIVSSPEILVGQTYHVYVGGDVQGTESAGVYDIATVTGRTDAAKQQCYSDTASFVRPGPPPDGNPPEPPPEFGVFDSQNPNFGPGSPQEPDGASPNGSAPPPPPPGGFGGSGGFVLANSNGKRNFVMAEKVNGFQTVTDYAEVRFDDVTESDYFYDSIMWAAGSKIAEGVGENKFDPHGSCSRGQTALYMWRAAGSPQVNDMGGSRMPPSGDMAPGAAPNMNSEAVSGANPEAVPSMNPEASPGAAPSVNPETPPGAAPSVNPGATPIVNPFTDVQESDEYYQAVLWAVQNGITKGVTGTEFRPDQTVTRAQSQTFLYRWAGNPEVSDENPFTDVTSDEYYYDAARWSVQNGITEGVSPTTFDPFGTLSKAHFLTFLYRYRKANLMPAQFGGPPPQGPAPENPAGG